MTVAHMTYWDRLVTFLRQSDLDDEHRAAMQSFDRLVEDTKAHTKPKSYERKMTDAKHDALMVLEP